MNATRPASAPLVRHPASGSVFAYFGDYRAHPHLGLDATPVALIVLLAALKPGRFYSYLDGTPRHAAHGESICR